MRAREKGSLSKVGPGAWVGMVVATEVGVAAGGVTDGAGVGVGDDRGGMSVTGNGLMMKDWGIWQMASSCNDLPALAMKANE